MNKLSVYTFADKRPDFIELQYMSLKKHLKDDFELVVFNNALGSIFRRMKIDSICRGLQIRSCAVKRNNRFLFVGGKKAISWGRYVNPNVACAYPINYAWGQMCEENRRTPFAIIDSDMFLCRDVSFVDLVSKHDASLILQYRGLTEGRSKASVTYLWNAFGVFDPMKIPSLEEVNWDCGVVHGHSLDVGGFSHFWLEGRDININHLSEYAILNYKARANDTVWLDCSLNGNYHFSFSYNLKDKGTFDYHCYEAESHAQDEILPHFPRQHQGELMLKFINYFERHILDKQTYPSPTFLGFVECESFSKTPDPFIIHHKAGSGYMGFPGEYEKEKLRFIKQELML